MDTDVDVDNFLAHFGKKGMKWGVRKSEDNSIAANFKQQTKSGASKAAPQQETSQGMSKKKKFAIGAGIVGGVAVVALGTYAVNNQLASHKSRTLADARKRAEAKLAGEKAARAQIQAFGKKSKWELMTTLPNPPKSSPVDAPTGKAKVTKGQRKTKEAVDTFVSKSKWQLMTDLPSKSKGVKYSSRDVKKDVKLYGDKGAARIQKNVNKGMLLSQARQKEAVRQNGAKAIQIALNINKASKKESADYKRLKKLVYK